MDESFDNIVEQGENTDNQHFSIFLNIFCPFEDKPYYLSHIKYIIWKKVFSKARYKILSSNND